MRTPEEWTPEEWAQFDRDLRLLEREDPDVAAAAAALDEALYGRCVACRFLSLRRDGWCSEHRPVRSQWGDAA